MAKLWSFAKISSLILSVSVVMLSFQNCSPGFKSALDPQADSSSVGFSEAPVTCSLPDGTPVSPGNSVTGFAMMSAVSPLTCGNQVRRTCLDSGTFDGAVPVFSTCNQQCLHPDNNQAVNSGSQYVYFTRSSGATQAECDAARITTSCQQATGLFAPAVPAQRFATCLVAGQTCAYTSSAGTATPTGNMTGATVTGFAMASATYPNLCGSTLARTCQASGQWTGTVPVFTSCSQKCLHPDTNQAVDSGSPYIFFSRATGTTAECAAARVSSSCQAGTGLFSPVVTATRFAACQIQDVIPPVAADIYKPDDGAVISASNKVINVSNATQLLAAIAAANPADAITLSPGNYRLTDSKVRFSRSGTATSPIFIRALNQGDATIELCNLEGFSVTGSNWIFENLVVRGVCTDGTNNEHAFHLFGTSSNTILRNNRVVNFMSHVKVNCDISGTTFTCPSNIKFLYNRFFDDKPISGNAPFNVVNIDGANNVVVRGNLFYDFASANTSKSSTAIYPKMHSNNVLVEQNLVVCEKNVVTGSNRRGINIGDSLDGNQYCINSVCKSYNGTFRNNIVLNCQGAGNSFGIGVINQYTSDYFHNTTLNVKQNWYDSTAPATGNLFKNNIFSQRWASQVAGYVPVLEQNQTLARADGTDKFVSPTQANLSPVSSAVAASLAVGVDAKAAYDFCGFKRGAMTSVGAIDYSHPNVTDCLNKINQSYQKMILD